MKIDTAKEEIRQSVCKDCGAYSFVDICAVLRKVLPVCGYTAVNDLIDDFDLTEMFDIQKVRT